MDKLSAITRSLAKKYTDESVEGAGAIKGKNCQIQSIEPITGGNRVTFAWYDGSDVLKSGTMDVMDGADGQDGAKGDKGDKGDTGETGATGNGIASIEKTGTSGLVDTYTITMTNGDTATFTVTNGQDGTATDINAYHVDDTAETGLDDEDYVPFYDTSATGMRKSLWSNIKGVLKTYFDTLYKSINDVTSEKIIGTKTRYKSIIKCSVTTKEWTGLTNFSGDNVWSDGNNIYYSNSSAQYVLNKNTGTWNTKTWTGLTNFSGKYVWTDGNNIFYGDGYSFNQYILNTITNEWEQVTWTDGSSEEPSAYPDGTKIWTDNKHVFMSTSNKDYTIITNNNSRSIFEASISGWASNKNAKYIWSDGTNIYYSIGSTQLIFDSSNSSWSATTFSPYSPSGDEIWTDGKDIYWTTSESIFILNKGTKILSPITINTDATLTYFNGSHIWTDGENIYLSYEGNNYILSFSTSAIR